MLSRVTFARLLSISALGAALGAPACGPASRTAGPPGAGGAAGPGAAAAFSSETTPLYPSKQCTTLVPAEDGGDPVLGCPARPGYKVEVSFSAWATHVAITGPRTNVTFSGMVGDHLEWRLAGGEPFAVIASVDEQGPDDEGKLDPAARKLLIRGVGGWEIQDALPESSPGAAQAARDFADGRYRAQQKPQ